MGPEEKMQNLVLKLWESEMLPYVATSLISADTIIDESTAKYSLEYLEKIYNALPVINFKPDEKEGTYKMIEHCIEVAKEEVEFYSNKSK